MKDWTIFFYISEDDKNRVSSFFMDLANISSHFFYDNITVLILYSARYYYGSYYICLDGDVRKNPLTMHPLFNLPEMHKMDTVDSFISFGRKYYPSTKYSIFFGMHCHAWYLNPSTIPQHALHIQDLSNLFMRKGFYFDILGFDCCYMSTLEVVFEFKDSASFIIACENASPDLGFNSDAMMFAFATSNSSASSSQICKTIAYDFIKRNNTLPRIFLSPTDVSVLSTRHVDDLIRTLKTKLHLQAKDIKLAYKLVRDDSTYTTYDLLAIIRDMPTDNLIESQFHQVILLYLQNNLLKQDPYSSLYTGLAFSPFPSREPVQGSSYKDLRFFNIIKLKYMM
jgi:hypothetical protein